jgi:hypothetical protein
MLKRRLCTVVGAAVLPALALVEAKEDMVLIVAWKGQAHAEHSSVVRHP